MLKYAMCFDVLSYAKHYFLNADVLSVTVTSERNYDVFLVSGFEEVLMAPSTAAFKQCDEFYRIIIQ
jgi:hypothetical protein